MSTNEKWHIDPKLPLHILDSQGREVAAVFIGNLSDAGAYDDALLRAKLVALAPEIVKALRDCADSVFALVSSYKLNPSDNETFVAARAILDKLETK